MKVLLSAFSCAPGCGSEPNVGWNVARQVASRHETWVLTDRANEPRITAALPSLPEPRPRFVFISPDLALARRFTTGLGSYRYYLAWQIAAFRAARRLQQTVGFDLVHHVTYCQSWLPSWLGHLGVPFIWNAGGRDRTPWAFLRGMSRRAQVDEVLRNVAVTALGRLAIRLVGPNVQLIVTASELGRWPPGLPVTRFPVGGLDDADRALLRSIPPRDGRPFRLLSVGRLLGLKGFHLALAAFARLRRDFPESEYWIVGDGPERQALDGRARALGCASAVRFWGWQTRTETLQRLAEADALVHPSLHEQFGYVVLEAMAAGRPVICLDVGGPAVLVQDGCGFRIPVRDPEQVINDLYRALQRLATDPLLRQDLGARARQRAEEQFSWEAVGRWVLDSYQLAMGGALRESTV